MLLLWLALLLKLNLLEILLNSQITVQKVVSSLWKCPNKKRNSKKSKKEIARNIRHVKKVDSDLLSKNRLLKFSRLPLNLLDSVTKRLVKQVATLLLFKSQKLNWDKKKLSREQRKESKPLLLNNLNRRINSLKDLSEELPFLSQSLNLLLNPTCPDQDSWILKQKRSITPHHSSKLLTLIFILSQLNNKKLLRLKFNLLKNLLPSLLRDSWMPLSKAKDLTLSPLKLKKSLLSIRNIWIRNKINLKIRLLLKEPKIMRAKKKSMITDSLSSRTRSTHRTLERTVEESLVLPIRRNKTSWLLTLEKIYIYLKMFICWCLFLFRDFEEIFYMSESEWGSTGAYTNTWLHKLKLCVDIWWFLREILSRWMFQNKPAFRDWKGSPAKLYILN